MTNDLNEKELFAEMDDETLEIGFITTPYFIAKCKELKPAEFRLWVILFGYKGTDGLIFPSQQQLAEDMGMSVDYVKEIISSMKKKGFLESWKEGQRSVNYYKLKYPLKVKNEYLEKMREQKQEKNKTQEEKQLITMKNRIKQIGARYEITISELEKLITSNIRYSERVEGEVSPYELLKISMYDYKKWKGQSKRSNSLTKGFISFFKHYGVIPTEEQLHIIDDALGIHKPGIISDVLEKMGNMNIPLTNENLIEQIKQKNIENGKKGIAINNNKQVKKNPPKQHNGVSNHDEAEEFIRRLKEERGEL